MSDELANGEAMNHQDDLAGDVDELETGDQDSAGGIRVILADSQAIYRVGMRKVFALEDDIRVVAQAETLENLYAALQHFPTDVVLLEGHLIAGTVDAIPEFMRRAPHAKLIVQISSTDEGNTVELFRRGVRGVVPRSISPGLRESVSTTSRWMMKTITCFLPILVREFCT